MSTQLSYVEGGPPQCSPFPVADSRTGGGGGLYSDPEVEEKTPSSSSSEESSGETSIASTLRDLGVFLLAPPKRLRIARELAAAGITTQELLELAEFVAESEPDEARRRRYLAAVVANPDVAALALRDVQHYRAKNGRPAKKPTGPAVPASEHDAGARLRASNMEAVRRFEAEFAAAVARGEVTTKRAPHAWEQRR